MKTNFFKYAAFAAVAMVAASCSDENGDPTPGLGENEYYAITEADLSGCIEFSSTVAQPTPGSGVLSWIDADAKWSKNADYYTSDEITSMYNAAKAKGSSYILTSATSCSGGLTLKKDEVYILAGALTVKSGETLTIEEGVTIIADSDDECALAGEIDAVTGAVDFIIVCQGGTINAVGTAANPIVMTATSQTHGAWGGIHLCGYATTNLSGDGTGSSEVGGMTYGGSDSSKDTDSSGTLKYIRVDYSGQKLDTAGEYEANGITFYGVGSGTVVENCCIYEGADDGCEWFGGTVNCSNIIIYDCQDDSFDWTSGFRGTLTNCYAVQNYDWCDCLIEADNRSSDNYAEPTSCPTLNDFVLVGVNHASNESKMIGVRLRVGTNAIIKDMYVFGKKYSFDIISAATTAYFKENTSTKISGVYASGSLSTMDDNAVAAE